MDFVSSNVLNLNFTKMDIPWEEPLEIQQTTLYKFRVGNKKPTSAKSSKTCEISRPITWFFIFINMSNITNRSRKSKKYIDDLCF